MSANLTKYLNTQAEQARTRAIDAAKELQTRLTGLVNALESKSMPWTAIGGSPCIGSAGCDVETAVVQYIGAATCAAIVGEHLNDVEG